MLIAMLIFNTFALAELIVASVGGAWSTFSVEDDELTFGLRKFTLNGGAGTWSYPDSSMNNGGIAVSVFLGVAIAISSMTWACEFAALIRRTYTVYAFEWQIVAIRISAVCAILVWVLWLALDHLRIHDISKQVGLVGDGTLAIGWCWILSMCAWINIMVIMPIFKCYDESVDKSRPIPTWAYEPGRAGGDQMRQASSSLSQLDTA